MVNRNITASITRGGVAFQNDLLTFASAPFLGQVATRCEVTTDRYTGSFNPMGARKGHYARDNLSVFKVVFPWFYVNGGDLAVGATATIEASVEYPAGTFTRILFSGVNTGNLPDGGLLISDDITLSIPFGAKFWVRSFVTSANTSIVAHGTNSAATMGDGLELGVSTTNKVMSGTITQSAAPPNGLCYGPCAIIAQTRRPSILIAGDSRNAGVPGVLGSETGDEGQAAPSLGLNYGYIKIAKGGETAVSLTQALSPIRISLGAYVSHVECNYGINSWEGGVSTGAANLTLMTSIRALFPTKAFYAATIPPATTTASISITSITSVDGLATATVASTANITDQMRLVISGATPTAYNGTFPVTVTSATTFTYGFPGTGGVAASGTLVYNDNWATVVNQTPAASNTNRVNYNNRLRDGEGTTFTGIHDLADIIETSRDSGVAKAGCLYDGVHESRRGVLAIQNSGVINPAVYVR